MLYYLTIYGALAFVLLVVYRQIVYPLFLSPLSKIPNAYITSPIIPFKFWSQQSPSPNTRAVFALHKKHGPILRLGPNEISCATTSALRTIYLEGFEKEKLYEDLFRNYDVSPLVAQLASKPHAVLKRMLSNVYSKSYLQSSSDLQKISQHLIYNRLLPVMRSKADKSHEMDVFDFNQAIAIDFISAYLFGLSVGTDFINNVEYRQQWYKEYEFERSLLPCERRDGRIEEWCQKHCDSAEQHLHLSNHEVDPKLHTNPIVYAGLTQGLSKTDKGQTEPQFVKRATASEMLDHIVAGYDTSAVTLTYLMYELSKQPELQARLREELLSLDPQITFSPTMGSTAQLPSPRSIDSLSFLDSILQETLRLYAPAPARQPRVTPYVPGGITIDGYSNIPGGVVVSANAYTLHRNADVFPEPEKWVPDRWLDKRLGQKAEMKRSFWAFSSGARMCIGSHFALQEIKLVIAAIYTNYATEVVDDEGIEPIDGYIAKPVGERLILRFKYA